MSNAPKPLAGIRVIDLSRVLAGPYCGQMLADLGAEVVKVESPEGDENRGWAPLVGAEAESASFLSVNRGKRGITLNLRSPDGRDLLDRLLERADVLVQNFLPGTAAKLGVEPEALLARHPRLIVCSVSAYGGRGPWRDRPGYDGILQAFSGLMGVTGEPDGGPVRIGASSVDMATGLIAFGGVVTALYARAAGRPFERHVQTSLLEAGLSLVGFHAVGWLEGGVLPRREGSSLWNLVPYQAFRCADGAYIMTGALNDAAWRRLCDVIGRPDLRDDPRYATAAERVPERPTLVPIFEAAFASAPAAEWIARLEAGGVAVSRINTMEDVFAHEQTLANDMAVTARRADGTTLRLLGLPFKLGPEARPAALAPPRLGEHTGEVLADWLGLDADEASELRRSGAFSAPAASATEREQRARPA
jgi:crotonobetainyl-CoA:carnitine CoA-transferase CaiB-like acyl-CoA transferase